MSDDALSAEDERRIREIFDTIPYIKHLGIQLGEIKRGTATLHLEISDDLKRNNGVVHGGAVASLVDTAAAFAIMTTLEPGETTTTIDLTIHFLRPIRGRAVADARVVRAGRRVSVIAIEVVDEAKLVAATALTSFIKQA
ncbi:MAG: hypothetical protein QOJ64_1885 [Acidobacteriota bacterium]|jgi:uncharacterized protein (TIGR00369 family)|nr:hypothetical protein [Acidobacteriota bacterium]